MDKFLTLLKIAGCMVFAYIFVLLFTPVVFIEKNAPTVRKNIPQYLAQKVQNLIGGKGKDGELTNSQLVDLQRTTEERFALLQQEAFQTVTKGVKARERSGVSEVIYDTNNMEFKVYKYTFSDGTVGEIKVPAGMSPPPGAE